jgi:hypothetical protein
VSRTLPAPQRLSRDLQRTRSTALEIAFIVQRIGVPYADAYDASLSSLRSGSIAPIHRSIVPTDPTGDVATSGLHKAMRSRVGLAAKRCSKALSELEKAQDDLLAMFLATDHTDPHLADEAG